MVYPKSMTKRRKMTDAEANNQTFANLPYDLTLLIMSRLSSKDNIRASAVCKTWQEACVSVRVKDPIPWLMFFPSNKEDREYKLYDPSLSTTYTRKFPDGGSYIILCSNDGWLLMHDIDHFKTFFFNPFTRDCIRIPWSGISHSLAIGLSCAPTSKTCVIFTISDISKSCITIKTYHLVTKVCNTFTVSNKLPRNYGGFQHVVFSDGVFYCLTNIGGLGMFNLSTSSWDFLPRRPPKCLKINKYCFMTEYQGDIFLIYLDKDNFENPTHLKLDLINRRWITEKKKISVAGFTFYSSFMYTLTTRNKFVMCTKEMPETSLDSIWILPPINVSEIFRS